MHFSKKIFLIGNTVWLKCVCEDPFDIKPSLIQGMTWCQTCAKPLPEPMMTKICYMPLLGCNKLIMLKIQTFSLSMYLLFRLTGGDHLVFIMEILLNGKMVFILKWPWFLEAVTLSVQHLQFLIRQLLFHGIPISKLSWICSPFVSIMRINKLNLTDTSFDAIWGPFY